MYSEWIRKGACNERGHDSHLDKAGIRDQVNGRNQIGITLKKKYKRVAAIDTAK